MQSLSLHSSPNPWLIRVVTFLLAAVAAGSASYWMLKWPTPTSPTRAIAAEPAIPTIDTAKVAQLLGASTYAPNAPGPAISAQARYKLLGVIAEGARGGSALIAIDAEPAKPYRVGEHLSDKLVLKSVKARSVTLAGGLQDNDGLTLELPPLPGAP